MRNFIVEKDFIVNGYRCVIIGGNLGHRCGYIGLPKGHPFYGKDYDYIDLNVHGGLTYCGNGHGTYPVKNNNNLWWIGFDCGHCGDGKDFELIKKLNDDRTYKVMFEIEKKFSTSEWDTVRTKEYVEQELIDAVQQLKTMDLPYRKYIKKVMNRQKLFDKRKKLGRG